MGGMRRTHGAVINAYTILVGKHEEVASNTRMNDITLNLKYSVSEQRGITWLRTETCRVLFEYGFRKVWRNS